MDDSKLSNTKNDRMSREFFQQVEFERSKKWANFIDRIQDTDIENAWNLDDFDEIYDGEDDNENEDLDESSENMAEEVDTLDGNDLNTTKRGNQTITKNITISNAQSILTQIRNNSGTNVINSDIKEILEETLPVIEEHKRNWRETGFEGILNTFDLHKIEKNVGDWMRRNNSFCCQDTSQILKLPFNEYKFERWHCKKEPTNDSFNETDSDSIDTARYIRSSKKHVGLRKRYATTTTMIKSYRLVESKRNELRRKYAYQTIDDMMPLLNNFCCQQKNKLYGKPYDFGSISYGVERKCLAHDSHRIRKKYHRRTCRNLNMSYTSSDEEEEDLNDMKHSLRSKTFANIKTKDRCCCKSEKCFSRTLCCSAIKDHNFIASNYNSKHERSWQPYRKQNSNYHYLREPECACKESNKLCKNIRLLANSSSDDGLVDNCDTSDEGNVLNINIRNGIDKKLPKLRNASHQKLKDDLKLSNENRMIPISKSNNKNAYYEEDSSDNELKTQRRTTKKNVSSTDLARKNYKEESSRNEFKNQTKEIKGKVSHTDLARKHYEKDLPDNEFKTRTKEIKKKVSHTDLAKKHYEKYLPDNEFKNQTKEIKKKVSHTDLAKKHYENDLPDNEFKTQTKTIKKNVSSTDLAINHKSKLTTSSDEEEPHTASLKKTPQKSKMFTKPSKNKITIQNFAINAKRKAVKEKEKHFQTINDDTYLDELEAAIKASKETYANECKNRDKEKSNSKRIKAQNNEVTKKQNFSAKSLIDLIPESETETDYNDCEEEQRKSKNFQQRTQEEKNISLKSSNNKKRNLSQDNRTEINDKYTKQKLPTISENEPTTEDHNRNDIVTNSKIYKAVQSSSTSSESGSNENTFLANAGGICNSTAVDKAAISRQIHSRNISLQHATISSEESTKKSKLNEKSLTITKKKSTMTQTVSTTNQNTKTEQHSKSYTMEKINGCPLVSSTTDSGVSLSSMHNSLQKITKKSFNKPQTTPILLYNPKNSTIASDESIINNRFRVTKDYLASFIGEKKAMKFLKYYKKPVEFKLSSTVYYIPPQLPNSDDESSDDDDDILVAFGGYGNLKEVVK